MRLGPFPFCLYKDKHFIFRILIFWELFLNFFYWCLLHKLSNPMPCSGSFSSWIISTAAAIVLSASPKWCCRLLDAKNTAIAFINALASWISSLVLVIISLVLHVRMGQPCELARGLRDISYSSRSVPSSSICSSMASSTSSSSSSLTMNSSKHVLICSMVSYTLIWAQSNSMQLL